MTEINIAIIGYGLSGKVFHAPFIHIHPGFHLHTIVSSKDEAKGRYPHVRIARSYEEVLSDPAIDLVSICTPNENHYTQAKIALETGKHIILEKPVTPTAAQAQELFAIARKSNRHLFPFQNRRWDGDFLTVRKILDQKLLGKVVEFESRFERYTPFINRASWRYTNRIAGGTLYDLGVHLIDQALVLFGKPEAVFCRLFNQRENSIVDDSFDLKLIYPEINVTLKAGVFVREPGTRFSVHGTLGSYVKYGTDPQEEALRNGKMPGGKSWGKEKDVSWGILHTEINGKVIRKRIETEQGNYMDFFENVWQVLRNGMEPVIKQEEVVETLKIIEEASKRGGG